MQDDLVTPEEALHVLGTCLTEDEKEELVSIRHQISDEIDWKDLVGSVMSEFLCLMDGVILEGNSSEVIPFELLRETEQDYLYGDHENVDTRKKFVMLLLIKKLLGALKQDVNKSLDSILENILDYEVESELNSIANGEEVDDGDGVVELSAIVSLGEDGSVACSHVHKTVRKLPADGKKRKLDVLQTECRSCGEPLGKPRVCGSPFKSASKNPKVCKHDEAEWKEGEEGQTAICFDCGGVAPDPGKYKWATVGLEPYGDDPETDELEVIIPHA
jgi:hypothetical protein